jgi:hypothetical protein
MKREGIFLEFSTKRGAKIDSHHLACARRVLPKWPCINSLKHGIICLVYIHSAHHI